jgi:hypothetical protein
MLVSSGHLLASLAIGQALSRKLFFFVIVL